MPSDSRTAKPLNFASRSVCNLMHDGSTQCPALVAEPRLPSQTTKQSCLDPCPNLIVNHTTHEAFNHFAGDISKFHCGGSFSLSACTICLSSHNINSDPGFIPTA
jgi:hypothetical protein